MLGGIVLSALFWWRLARRDDRLLFVYLGGLVSAFLGAKLAYVVAEGWQDWGRPDAWARLAAGKSILGALLGGYAGVELAKRLAGFRGVTGDWFAMVAPAGVVIGRVGCWLHGCCAGRICAAGWFTVTDAQGTERWPSVPVELGFNLMLLAIFSAWRRSGRLTGQHFHVYLMAYGVFRFGHEFLRDTPRVWAGLTGYQGLALVTALFGAIAFRRRARVRSPQRLTTVTGMENRR